MPVLQNPRWEAFAQGLAKGRTQVEAYAEAGYKPHDANAARLIGNDKIKARVAELQTKVAAKAVITIEDMVRQADEDRDFARQNGHSAAAHAATMGKAKLLGMLVEKAEVKVTHVYEDMSDEELDRELEMALTGGVVTAH